MGGFLTGFFSAGGNEALNEKHRREDYNEAYRQANLQNLLRMREIAAQNGASADILGQLDQSIAGLKPGAHPQPQAAGPAPSTQTSVPPVQLPGMGVPMVGESPTTDITGNTPHAADAAPGQAPLPAPAPPADASTAPPQPGVFMANGSMPKPDTTPIVPPSIAGQPTPGPVIPGQPGPTVTGPAPKAMTPGQLLGQALSPVHLAQQQAYVKQIENQAAYEQTVRQMEQTASQIPEWAKKYNIPESQVQSLVQDVFLSTFAPRALYRPMNPRPYASGALSVADAIMESERGNPPLGQDNNPIPLGQLPQDAQLIPVYDVRYPGGVYYTVGSQPSKSLTVGGQVYNIPSRGGITPDNSTSLGAKNPPVSTTRQVPTAGQGTATLTTTRTPGTPGMAGDGQPQAPSSIAHPAGAPALTVRGGGVARDYQGNPLPADSVTTPQTTESGAPAPKGTASAKKPSPKKVGDFVRQANDSQLAKQVAQVGIEPDMNKLYPQQGTAARKALPALVATRGLFGDPERPELPTLSDFSDLANDPHAQRVLGAAFKLMENTPIELENPQGITDGTLATIAADNGFKNWQAQVMAKVQQQALAGATPRELQYFNAAINGMADVIGMRGATGQNAAKWSVQTMQNELPLIGTMGTKNQQAYLQKLMSLNSQAGNIINTMPDNARAKYWLKKRENDLKSLQDQAPPGPKNPQQGNDTVKMRAPNGQVQYVTPDQVSHYEKLGATVVK